MNKICLQCNKEFIPKISRGKIMTVFCSRICSCKSRIGVFYPHPKAKGKMAWNKGTKGICISYWKGKKRPEITRENHPKWIKDRTQIKKQEERNNPNDKQWKYAVYRRDNFKCKMSNKDCNGRIEAHHILSWRDYPELRFNINNGITLCLAHHPRKRAEEKRLSPYFQELVSVSN